MLLCTLKFEVLLPILTQNEILPNQKKPITFMLCNFLVRMLQYFLKTNLPMKTLKKLPSKVAYCKVASFNTHRLEAHDGFFRLLMKGIFDVL